MRRYALIGGLAAAAIALVAVLVAANTGSDDEPTAGSAPTTAVSVTTTVPPTPSTAPATTLPATTSTAPAARDTTTTSSTTSTSTTTTTTTTAQADNTSTTTSRPPRGRAPSISITAPGNLSRHQASYDAGLDAFAAQVSFSAIASDPEGGQVTIEWFSGGAALGTGPNVTATMRTSGDVSQLVVIARATDEEGNVAEASVQIIVWIPSDQ